MDADGRMSIACGSCAKAKVKCDKLLPCTRCTSKQIVCQSRSARSSDALARRAHRQLNPSKEAPGGFQSNAFSKPGEGEPSIPSQPTGTDHQLQWTTYPPSSIRARNRPAPIRTTIDVDASMQATAQPDTRESEAHILLDDLLRPSPNLSFPPTPILQDIRIEDFVQMNGNSWDQRDDRQSAMIGAIQTPKDLDMPNLTGFMSPRNSTPNVTGIPNIDTTSGMNQNFSAVWNFSPPTSFAYPASNRSPSVVSSLDSWRISHRSRSMSFHQRIVPEHQSVIATQDQWQSFRCNPVTDPNTCPKTARVHLDGLEQTLKNQETWISWGIQPHDDFLTDCKISIELFEGGTRDKLLAITQGFFHKALKTHPAVKHDSSMSHSATFIILPPSNVLEYFLRACICCCEPYYPFVPAGILKTNELMQLTNGNFSSLFLLLMIAQGATTTATVEARNLTGGLTEICRISLFDAIEKNGSILSHPMMLRNALLLTNLAAWSGDKWHMDIAMGQRGMYLAMLSNAGMLEFREMKLPPFENQANPGQAWKTWKEHESRNRLVYSWVTVDQELGLFHDTAPLISIANLHTTMPDSDLLWQAKSANEWLKIFHEMPETKKPFSLCDLFRRFMEAESEIAKNNSEFSAIQLRLLLHPLQALVCHFRQLLNCFFSDENNHRKTSRTIFRSTTRVRLDEIQSFLQQWYSFSVRYAQSNQSNTGFCPVSCVSLIMYHLISLNTIICFLEIERLARCDKVQDVFRGFSSLQTCCIEQAEEIFFHCGQILRLIRSMPNVVRPSWWAAAVYRVALISWVNCIANAHADFRMNRRLAATESDNFFAIDVLAPEHPSISRYLKCREGVPTFSKRDGSAISLAVPGDILTHCVDILQEESITRFAAGIMSKLERLAKRWKN